MAGRARRNGLQMAITLGWYDWKEGTPERDPSCFRWKRERFVYQQAYRRGPELEQLFQAQPGAGKNLGEWLEQAFLWICLGEQPPAINAPDA